MFPPPYFRRSSFLPYPPTNFHMPPPINRLPIPPAATGAAPSKLDQFLKTTDQLMKTAKTYEPYIQQATPLLKNLPAMWKLYKGFTSSNDSPSRERPAQRISSNRKPSVAARQPVVENPSIPRIYQPPFQP